MADLLTLKKFEALSPFEIKNELINLAKKTSKTTQSAFLNAGRGNPNWVATTPREGFFLLGQFAITESKRVMDKAPGIGGMPQASGIAGRLDAWLVTNERAELIAAIRRLAACRDLFPRAESFRSDGLFVECRPVVHTNHPTYGYRIRGERCTVVWAPEFFVFPAWAGGADLMFADGAARCRVFACDVGECWDSSPAARPRARVSR